MIHLLIEIVREHGFDNLLQQKKKMRENSSLLQVGGCLRGGWYACVEK
jgi:hypothetical protein